MFLAFVNLQYGISELPVASVSKRVFVRNTYYEDAFTFHENESRTRFEAEARGGSEISCYLLTRVLRTNSC